MPVIYLGGSPCRFIYLFIYYLWSQEPKPKSKFFLDPGQRAFVTVAVVVADFPIAIGIPHTITIALLASHWVTLGVGVVYPSCVFLSVSASVSVSGPCDCDSWKLTAIHRQRRTRTPFSSLDDAPHLGLQNQKLALTLGHRRRALARKC